LERSQVQRQDAAAQRRALARELLDDLRCNETSGDADRRGRRAKRRWRHGGLERGGQLLDRAVSAETVCEALPAPRLAWDEEGAEPENRPDRLGEKPREARGKGRAILAGEVIAQVVVGEDDGDGRAVARGNAELRECFEHRPGVDRAKRRDNRT